MEIQASYIKSIMDLTDTLNLTEEQKAVFLLWTFIKYLERKVSYKPGVSYRFNPKDKEENPLLRGIDLLEEEVILENNNPNYFILGYIFLLILSKNFLTNNISEEFDIHFQSILILEKDKKILEALENIVKKVNLITNKDKPLFFWSVEIENLKSELRNWIWSNISTYKERIKHIEGYEYWTGFIAEWLNKKKYMESIESAKKEFIELLKLKWILRDIIK